MKQLKTDTDSYNDNNGWGAQLPLNRNSEPDMEELEQDTEYDPPPLEDEGSPEQQR